MMAQSRHRAAKEIPPIMAEIKVLSSIATSEAYLELVPQFESATGHKVATTWAGTTAIMQRMAAGERYDLIVISSTELDELIRQGKIVAGSRVDLAKSGIGIAVRAGAPRPDVGSGAALKQALLAAKTVGYTSGPSGVYMAGLVERMGIAAEVKPKHRGVPSGGTIGTIVASGERGDRLPAGQRARAHSRHRLHRTAAAGHAVRHGVLLRPAVGRAASRMPPRRWWRFSPRRPPKNVMTKHGLETA